MRKFLFLVIFVNSTLFAQVNQVRNDTIYNSINRQFKNYLQKIQIGTEHYYGFKSRNDFDIVELGNPYQIFYLNDNLFNSNQVDTVINNIFFSDSWEFPLLLNNEIICFIHVIKDSNNQLFITGLGFNILAKEINELIQTSEACRKTNKLLIVKNLRGVYLIKDKDFGEFDFFPTKSTNQKFHNNYSNSYSKNKLYGDIKESLNKKENKI
mgnify:CR=1 FL=1|jgi:hypothetical protein